MGAWQRDKTREVGKNQIMHSLEDPIKVSGCQSVLSREAMGLDMHLSEIALATMWRVNWRKRLNRTLFMLIWGTTPPKIFLYILVVGTYDLC